MSNAHPKRRSARPQHKFSAIRSMAPPVDLSTPHQAFSFEDVASSSWMSSRVALCNFPLDHGHVDPVSLRRGGKATARSKKLPPLPAQNESTAAYATKKLPPIPDLHTNTPTDNVYQDLPGTTPAEAAAPVPQNGKDVCASEARVAEAHKPTFPKPLWPKGSEAKISRWEYYEFKFIKSPLRTLSKKLRRALKPQFTKFKADDHFTADFRRAQRKLEAVHGKVFSPKFGATHIEALPGPSRISAASAFDAESVPAEHSVKDIEITSWIQDMARTRSDLMAAACTASSSCYSEDMDPSAMPPPLRFSSKPKPAPTRRPSPSWV